jgi:hypothetical protein
LNKVQYWALGYHYYLRRRTEIEDRDSFLERQCMNLNYDMWLQVYAKDVLGELALGDRDEVELTTDDLGDLDKYWEDQEKADQDKERRFQQALTGTRTMSGAQTPLDWAAMNSDQATPVNWGPWQ